MQAVTERGINAAMMAAYAGHLEVVRHLTPDMLPPAATDGEGLSALHHAAGAGQARPTACGRQSRWG